jgi:uncharacterized protein YggE
MELKMNATKLLLSTFALVSAPLSAQQSDNIAPIPAISVASRGEVKVAPDRATIQISVQTKAVTAAAAAAENARKQQAVIDALRALGLGEKDISTTGYNVSPEQRYEQNREPVIVGYNVTNSLVVDLKNISMVGKVIDAALSKGANMINSLLFYSSNAESARREAIGIAVRKARLDAEAAAKAAGGSIGDLLEISIGAVYAPQPRYIEMRAQVAGGVQDSTPIQAGDQTIAVDISTRWRFAR